MKYFLIAIIVLCRGIAAAQITLLPTDYPTTLTGTDSLKITTAASALPPCITGPGLTWDFSIVTDSTPDFFAYRVADSAYTFADSTTNNKIIYFPYIANYHDSLIASGLYQYGFKVLDTNYNIGIYTGTSTDSFFIFGQDVHYYGRNCSLKFPVAIHDIWKSYYQSDLIFEITYTIGSTFSHQPGIMRSYFARKDTVTGWGKARVKDIAGNPSPYWDVLQVQTTVTRTDSFFLNGSPMPGTLLTTFLLTQGQKTRSYTQSYYRIAELTPLVAVKFIDSAFVTPVRAISHVGRLNRLQITENSLFSHGIRVFPNPQHSGTVLSVHWPGTDLQIKADLIDGTGRLIDEQTLNIINNKTEIKMPGNLPTGNYFLRLTAPGKETFVKAIELVN